MSWIFLKFHYADIKFLRNFFKLRIMVSCLAIGKPKSELKHIDITSSYSMVL